jgi:hypothetical protein
MRRRARRSAQPLDGTKHMRKSSFLMAALTVALVASNAFWLYKTVDSGVSYSYLNDSYQGARSTALQALAILPVATRVDSSQPEVVAAAAKAAGGADAFEKDGYTWVGNIGLKFDTAGRLIEARPSVEPF